MALYFIKDTTLSNIANAIRSKTGDSASIPVADFASEIESIVVGDGSSSGGGGSGEGNTIIGYEVVKKSGEFTTGTGVKSKNITHNCGGSPDLVIVYLNRNDLTACADYTTFVYSSSKIGIGSLSVTSGYAASSGSISCTSTTFNVSNLAENSRYKWVAMKLVDKEIPCGGDYTVTFMSEDGQTVLYEKQVMEHDNCANPVTYNLLAKPTKESTAQYDYTFSGWSTTQGGAASSSALTNITDDRTVYVAFNSAVRYYTVNFYDGETLLKQIRYEYGATPSYVPEKEDYEFIGWDKELAPVTGDANYYAQWAENIGGTCGDAATWSLKNGVLTISGTGAVSDRAQSSGLWYDYKDLITSVIIEEGITILGSNTFYKCNHLTSVTFPSSLIEIKGGAFWNIETLTNVVLPENIVTIGSAAFRKTGITSITIPASVIMINSGAFMECANLSSVVIEANTSTWKYYYYGSLKGTLSASEVQNPATMANYLATDTTYRSYQYKRT